MLETQAMRRGLILTGWGAAALACLSLILLLLAASGLAAKPKPKPILNLNFGTGGQAQRLQVGETKTVKTRCKDTFGLGAAALSAGGQGDVRLLLEAEGPTANGRAWFRRLFNPGGDANGAFTLDGPFTIDTRPVCAVGKRGLKLKHAASSAAGGASAGQAKKNKKKKLTLVVTAVTSRPANVPAGGTGTATATCPRRHAVVSAGLELNGIAPVRDAPTPNGRAWTVTASNLAGTGTTPVRVTAVCVRGKNGIKVAATPSTSAAASAKPKPALLFSTVVSPPVQVPALNPARPPDAASCPRGYYAVGAGLDLNGLRTFIDQPDDTEWQAVVANSLLEARPFGITVRCVTGANGLRINHDR